MNIEKLPLPPLSLESFLKRYPSDRRRRKMEPLYRAMLADVKRLATPLVLYEEFDLTEVANLTEWLQTESVAVVLAVCTLGSGMGQRVRELVQEDLAAATVIEEIALAGVTAVTRQLHRAIREQAQTRRLKAGPAYRPGLGRWPLTLQETIFDRLPAAQIGVTLNPSLVMEPVDSTSLIIPIMNKRKAQAL